MAERYIRKRKDLGLPPGTPVFVGEQLVEKVSMTYISYNKTDYTEGTIQNFETDFPEFTDDKLTWVNVTGVHDVNMIKLIGKELQIDPIILEDIVNTSARPKIEDLEEYFFVLLKDLVFDTDLQQIQQEQISFLVAENYLITFQEDIGDPFDIVRDRIRNNKGLIRKSKVDYLFNRLLDTLIDDYFALSSDLDFVIDQIEQRVISNPNRDTLKTIQNMKSELIYLRKVVMPVREIFTIISTLDRIVISESTVVFVKSIRDHITQVIDLIEIHREMLNSFVEMYLSSLSNRTNDVMKVLTIITSIFIPMSFLAGVYGMNFDNMPELRTNYGYFILWGVFVIIASSMLYYFKRIGWLNMS